MRRLWLENNSKQRNRKSQNSQGHEAQFFWSIKCSIKVCSRVYNTCTHMVILQVWRTFISYSVCHSIQVRPPDLMLSPHMQTSVTWAGQSQWSAVTSALRKPLLVSVCVGKWTYKCLCACVFTVMGVPCDCTCTCCSCCMVAPCSIWWPTE